MNIDDLLRAAGGQGRGAEHQRCGGAVAGADVGVGEPRKVGATHGNQEGCDTWDNYVDTISTILIIIV